MMRYGREEKRLQTRWTQGYRKAVTLADEIEGEEVFVGDKVKGMLARAQLGRFVPRASSEVRGPASAVFLAQPKLQQRSMADQVQADGGRLEK